MRRSIEIALLLLLLLVGSATWAQVAPRIGDWWRFDVSDERQGRSTNSEVTRKVVALEGELMVIEVTTRRPDGERKTRETRDMNLNVVESGNLLYRPHLDLFRLPLRLGKRGYSIERVQIDSGRVVQMAGEVEVIPTQRISTAAGEFEAQEVVARGRYIDPKTRDSSRYETRAWFAPAVGFWVKQDFLERNIQDTMMACLNLMDCGKQDFLGRNIQDTADFIRTKVVMKAYQLEPR